MWWPIINVPKGERPGAGLGRGGRKRKRGMAAVGEIKIAQFVFFICTTQEIEITTTRSRRE